MSKVNQKPKSTIKSVSFTYKGEIDLNEYFRVKLLKEIDTYKR